MLWMLIGSDEFSGSARYATVPELGHGTSDLEHSLIKRRRSDHMYMTFCSY